MVVAVNILLGLRFSEHKDSKNILNDRIRIK